MIGNPVLSRRSVPRRLLGALALTVGGLLSAAGSVAAQHAHGGTAHDGGPAAHGPAGHPMSAKAREQVAELARAVAALHTPDALQAAGFRPVFGMIPTMGVHWVNVGRMLDTVKFLEPAQLMLTQVDGKPQLAGVAYAFLGHVADAPDLFDGDQDVWHEHPELAPPGQSVVMLHVWFVPSPDGPFAGHNPWLAYSAAGVEPPADSALSVPVSALRARQLALALAEATEPLAIAQGQGTESPLEMAVAQVSGAAHGPMADSTLPPEIRVRRDSLRAAIPRLNAARRSGDQAAWDREADAAIAVWKQVRDAYLAALPEERRQGISAFYHEMETGAHDH